MEPAESGLAVAFISGVQHGDAMCMQQDRCCKPCPQAALHGTTERCAASRASTISRHNRMPRL
ncbi:MAG: hypothetical protein WAL73_10420 [Terracidiphilus sp.]